MSIFPIEKIDAIYDEDDRDDAIRDILNSLPVDDPPFLSNLLIHADESNGVVQTMEELAAGDYPFRWKILILRDEWGNHPKPGEVVTREIPINRVKRDGDLVTPRVLSKAKKDGSYSKRYVKQRKFEIDKKGCITCKFSDAVYFLSNWGYNKKTNSAITNKPEYSYEPVDMRDPTKGQKKHVRYWRNAEMDKEGYAALPEIGQKTKGNKENRNGNRS